MIDNQRYHATSSLRWGLQISLRLVGGRTAQAAGPSSTASRGLYVAATCLALLLSLPLQAQLQCTLTQFTDDSFGNIGGASFSGDGRWMAFAGGRFNIYLANLESGEIVPLITSYRFVGSVHLSYDGNRIAFESEDDHTGQNPDGNREIFLLDRESGEFTQITQTTIDNNFSPEISQDGLRVVFTSSHDLVGENPEQNGQAFLFDSSTGAIRQLTKTSSSIGLDGNADLDVFAYFSYDNLQGGNPDGNEELYLLDLTDSTLTQITNTETGHNFGFSLSGSGDRLSFYTTSEEFIGPMGGRELMLFERQSGTFTQLSQGGGGSGAVSILSEDGNRVTAKFENEIVLFDLERGKQQILAAAHTIIAPIAISSNGELTAIRTNGDLTGGNSDNSFELFLARCPVNPPCPADTLCLQYGRFQVQVEWRDFNGQIGFGQDVGVPSSDSGLLWFFNPDNWEMLVKVLDGCAINGHFWVFAAATTNVEYVLRVTDTTDGTVALYENPLGVSAAAITDTSAFASCP